MTIAAATPQMVTITGNLTINGIQVPFTGTFMMPTLSVIATPVQTDSGTPVLTSGSQPVVTNSQP